ncbi:MAG: DMT family transporter [Deltaproteobacteria bacterium]|nr:DMT family transporter [Deltaproteobacteria bacterium]
MDFSPQLIGLGAAVAYAAANIASRRGLLFSTPLTATWVSMIVQSVVLWAIVLLRGAIPPVAPLAVKLFIIVGLMMPVIRLLSYTGMAKLGAARSTPLRATHPLFSAAFAVATLKEEINLAIALGTIFVVVGIMLICWQREERISSYRRWHVLLPLAAALLAGVVNPIVRYALRFSNEPIFLSAVVGVVSLTTLGGTLALPNYSHRLRWNRQALRSFIVAALFETMGFLLFVAALSVGPVVLVAPFIGTTPMWVLIGVVILMRDIEKVNSRTVAGTLLTVAGTIVISVYPTQSH